MFLVWDLEDCTDHTAILKVKDKYWFNLQDQR